MVHIQAGLYKMVEEVEREEFTSKRGFIMSCRYSLDSLFLFSM